MKQCPKLLIVSQSFAPANEVVFDWDKYEIQKSH